MNKALAEHVKVFKGTYNFIVVIFGSVYEMSTDCCVPNGVNYYMGDTKTEDLTHLFEGDSIPLIDVNDNIKRGIANNIDYYLNLDN